MNILTLSDHAAEQAEQASARREAEYKLACSRYNDLLFLRGREMARLSALRRGAWAQRRYLLWLLRWLPCIARQLAPTPPHPQPREAQRDEIVWSKGSEGEQKVVVHLSRLLDHRWTLIGGYRNARGEVDQLLVGPGGVVAIEIKFVNGRVSCNGDRWWRDKNDRYGNLVERAIPIADKRGRAPSRQVNEVVDLLERQIGKRVGVSRIIRAVVLSHDRSRLGDIRNPTVDLITTLGGLDVAALSGEDVLTEERVQLVVDSIRREHRLFEAPRARVLASSAGGRL